MKGSESAGKSGWVKPLASGVLGCMLGALVGVVVGLAIGIVLAMIFGVL